MELTYRANIAIFGLTTATTLEQDGQGRIPLSEVGNVIKRVTGEDVEVNVINKSNNVIVGIISRETSFYSNTFINADGNPIRTEYEWNTRVIEHTDNGMEFFFVSGPNEDIRDEGSIKFKFDEKGRVCHVANMIESFDIEFDTDGFVGNREVFLTHTDPEVQATYPSTVTNELTAGGLIGARVMPDGERDPRVYMRDAKGKFEFCMAGYSTYMNPDQTLWLRSHNG